MMSRDALQAVREGRRGTAELGGACARARRAEAQLVGDCRYVVRGHAADALGAARVGERRMQQLAVAIQLDGPARERPFAGALHVVEVRRRARPRRSGRRRRACRRRSMETLALAVCVGEFQLTTPVLVTRAADRQAGVDGRAEAERDDAARLQRAVARRIVGRDGRAGER